ncbi:Oidioi.mRNA.OKI2018_I69.XSR.g16905.t1.cds [Oikopleura dioica]|uniref:Oidioi.mRNA.OKI2018_I69.XSR.g16905.t1.cds n=1 Tax=Oikopleura dioica TaxID=34765 RepID=A0ABN7SHK6_OIKDI|nr:Oidioi.mRNA.OKI2018_I69.XSR.g16905.t1.cds [Oikopleura dioica]
MLKATLISLVMGSTLDPLYWTVTDQRFETEPFHKITVRIGDKMDLICPRHGDGLTHDGKMFHKIYEVSKEAFENCDSSQGKRLISCDQPTKEKKYTVLFQELNPSPYGLEFLPGETYYYISTGDGIESGMDKRQGGGCSSHNMKLAIAVEAEDFLLEENGPSNGKLTSGSRGEEGPLAEEIEEIENNSALIIGIAIGAAFVMLIVVSSFFIFRCLRNRNSTNDKMVFISGTSPVDITRVAGNYATQDVNDLDFIYHTGSEQSTNQSYVTRDSYTPGDVCEV